jgi:hypothetical protein
MIFNTNSYVGIRRTRQIGPVQCLRSIESITAVENKLTIKTDKPPSSTLPITTFVNASEKEALKSIVKRLISTDGSFLSWFTYILCDEIMPTYHPDPTPAEAAKVPPPPKHRRGGKRIKGAGGDARPQAAPAPNVFRRTLLKPPRPKALQPKADTVLPATLTPLILLP